MKPKHFNSIFSRLFQRVIVFLNRKSMLLAEDLKHDKQSGWQRKLFRDGFEKPRVIHAFGSPPEDVVAALVAGNAGDPSMLDELIKQGYIVGTIKEAGEIFHKLKTRHHGFESKQLSLVANESALLANATESCSPFAILQGDSFFVPYGEFPHKQGLQKFDRKAAEEMAANHKGLLNRMVSWARGEAASYPVYIGHPDLPGSKDSDKRAYGWIENMIPEADGMRLPVKWSSEGRELVENAHFKFYSPLWWTRKSGKFILPVSLKSMGLTNDPNIPVPALANEVSEEIGDQGSEMEENLEQETEQIENMKEILTALGLEDGAAPEAVVAKITELQTAANEATEAVEKLKAEKLKAEEEKIAAANELATATGKIVAFETSLQAAANHAVASAVSAGRLTLAEVEAKTSEILAANDFAVALQDLGKMPAKVKTTSATGDLGGAKSRLVVAANDEGKARREERAQLVENEFQATNPAQSVGERKRIAWQRAQRKNPDLFGKADSSGADA